MRLHELAKEIGAESKSLLALAKELGLKVRNHSSNLEVGEVAILKAAYREEHGASEPEEEPVEEPTAAPKRKLRVRRRKPSEGDSDTATEEEPAPVEAQHDFEPEPDYEPEPALPTDAPVEAEPAESASAATDEFPEPTGPAETEPSSQPAPMRPAAEGTATIGDPTPAARKAPTSTGKPPQTPTPRRKPAGGARIVGRIELPPEELNRQQRRPTTTTTTTSGGAGSSVAEPYVEDPNSPGADRTRTGPGSAREAAERRRQAGGHKLKEAGAAWNPDDEDDPLLQGIRLRNIQTGPHTRRPPRRVGPRRAGRRAPAPIPTGPVEITYPISVRDLSQALGAKANQILRILMQSGSISHVNSSLDENAILEVATALNREVNLSAAKGKEDEFLEEVSKQEQKLAERAAEGESPRASRAPVVAFLGHVDHGKTSLLDKIRDANVAGGEAGGITQSMRAYSVPSPAGGSITFLDTPGHKAFTEMRSRGANITDIVVLVVAADDGVMPQTEEAIQHALAAEVPIVVAMNKMDRAEANPDRVLQQLASAGVMVEGWGGEVQVAPCSAITGDGIDDLLEKISLQAEIMDLKADSSRPARGTVIEAHKDDQLGAVATVLVQDGTLRVGEMALSGTAFGRIRKLVNDQGKSVEEAGPSTPVNVIGLNSAPNASDPMLVVEDLKKAREVAEERSHSERLERVAGPTAAAGGALTLESLFANIESGKTEEVKVVLRCDVKGSLEVVRRSLDDLQTDEVKVKTIRDALGGITEDDVLLALASGAAVIGFNVVPDEKARAIAEDKGIEIRTYQVIYELIDDMKAAMEGMLSPIQKEKVVGHVEIREVFKVSRLGSIAGCRVVDGIIRRNSKVRVTRDGRMIYTGSLSSLKRFKDDVREVKEGMECGLHVDGYDDIKVGDVVEVIEVEEEKRTLEFSE